MFDEKGNWLKSLHFGFLSSDIITVKNPLKRDSNLLVSTETEDYEEQIYISIIEPLQNERLNLNEESEKDFRIDQLKKINETTLFGKVKDLGFCFLKISASEKVEGRIKVETHAIESLNQFCQ